MFPTLIVDDFFPDPDKIVEFAEQQEFYPNDGRWPGTRTAPLHELDNHLFNYISTKIHSLFYDRIEQYFMEIKFQKITPFHEDQYHPKNRGWIHKDKEVYFGGIIYLNKNPDDDTGTSLYRETKGYSYNDGYTTSKEKLYKGHYVSEEQYCNDFESLNSQYTETVNVKNVYNRLLMFNSKQYHGVQTFGKTQDRLTISLFSIGLLGDVPPLYRSL